jgi:hypothetical protein
VKLVRPAVAVALGASLVVAGSAGAAPKPVCNLVTDPAGDARPFGVVPNDDTMDLVSADFGNNAKMLTVVVRVKKAATTSSTYPTGLKWQTTFTLEDKTYFASVVSDGGVSGAFGTTGTGSNTILTRPAAVIDPAKNEIRITVPLVDFPSTPSKSATISGISVSSATTKAFNTPAISGSLGGISPDQATTDKSFKLGTSSCVVVGK